MIHYWSNFNCTIKPLLNIPVRNLDAGKVAKFTTAAGATSKRGNGRAWARTAFNNVRAAMKWAHQEGIINSNPIEGIKFEYDGKEKVRKSIPVADYHAILDACEGKDSFLIWQVLVATGARKGEITALDVGDIDFRNGTIFSDKQATGESHGRLVREGTKTEEDATIRLRPALLEALRQHVGDRPADSPLFLGPQNRSRLAFGTLGRWWKRDVAAAGLAHKKYVIHQLRHTFATVALDGGADLKGVSKMLRHRSVVTTMNIYRDVKPSTVDAINVLVETALSRPVTTPVTTRHKTTPSEDVA
jgi:integrase